MHPEHTVAVGDGNNDIEMLRWARDSYAMGNAPDAVIAAAGAPIGPVDEDGVLEVLEPLDRPLAPRDVAATLAAPLAGRDPMLGYDPHR